MKTKLLHLYKPHVTTQTQILDLQPWVAC